MFLEPFLKLFQSNGFLQEIINCLNFCLFILLESSLQGSKAQDQVTGLFVIQWLFQGLLHSLSLLAFDRKPRLFHGPHDVSPLFLRVWSLAGGGGGSTGVERAASGAAVVLLKGHVNRTSV